MPPNESWRTSSKILIAVASFRGMIMKMFFTYFRLELKRSIRILPWIFLSILIMFLAIAAGIFTVSHFMQQSQAFEAITVGITIPEEEKEAKLIATVLSNMESVKGICRFEYLGEEEAKSALAQGELEAVILIESDFYQDVNTGINTPAIILLPEEISLNTAVFKELLQDGVSLIRTAEAAIYSVTDATREFETKITRRQMENLLTYLYIETAFERNQIFQKSLISASGDADLYQYYFIALASILLVMCGLNFGFLYQKQDQAVEQKLKIYGINSFQVSMVKILIMGSALWAIAMIFYLSSCMVCHFLETTFLMFDSVVALGLLPETFAMAAFFHLIYAHAGIKGGVLIFFVNAFMIICSGGIVPAVYLPEAVRILGSALPLTFWNQYGAELVFGQLSLRLIFIEGLIILTGMVIGSIKIWKKA